MDTATLYDDLRRAIADGGPLLAIDRLCERLAAAEDFQALFYAKLLRKRVELGVSPFPTGPSSEVPVESQSAYEDAIRDAGRSVGRAYLDRNQLAKAWGYFRMLDEPEPVREYLDRFQPGPEDDTYGAVEIAWQHGVHPKKGLDIVLDRHGICSAITMVGGTDLTKNPELRDYCVKRLVRSLHGQLKDRLAGDLAGRDKPVDANASIAEIVAGADELFADDAYHIDISHLSSVVQMSLQLPACDELALARDLAAYGEKLSANLQGDRHAPFDRGYSDFAIYLDILAGRNVDEGLDHFERKLPYAAEIGDTFPAEVFVNLLLRLDRTPQALAVAQQYLNDPDGRELSCPSIAELARRANDYSALAASAQATEDPVLFLAGLIAERQQSSR